MRETQQQHSTALAHPVGVVCHIAAGSVHGLCCPGQARPPVLEQGPGMGSSPKAILQCSKAPGATEERWLCRVRDLDYVFNNLPTLRDTCFLSGCSCAALV